MVHKEFIVQDIIVIIWIINLRRLGEVGTSFENKL